MPAPILATKLFIPPARPKVVLRTRLIEQLNESLRRNQGFERKLTLISASAGFGKTTLVSEWIHQHTAPDSAGGAQPQVAWYALDEGDNDPARFLAYLVTALQTLPLSGIEAEKPPPIGAGVMGALQSPQPPTPEALLTMLLNEITAISDNFILVLDDYHVIDAKPVEMALTFLLEHLPPQMHLVIITREDPQLPLARYRVRGQLIELRAADLRFTPDEAAAFLNQIMALNLSAEEITALEARTEGWIAGLQLAALALQGLAQPGALSAQAQPDTTKFIQSFTGSHHFVLDYLVAEVLQQQTESVQAFLLQTSILDRMCAPLCEAVCAAETGGNAISGQETLEYLQQANLFIVPLDNERRWYRYHRLFADLLRQRLQQSAHRDERQDMAEYHIRASIWYEENGLEIEALQHAAAANDIDRAARLVVGKGIPLHFRGAITPVLHWLGSLPAAELDARPALWVMYASALSMTGQITVVEEKLQAAEAAIAKTTASEAELDAATRNLIGHIAAIRALLAASQYRVEAIITESQRALEYLHPDNLAVRTATIWKMGLAYHLQKNRPAARQAYAEAMSISQTSGNRIIQISAASGLGAIQEAENQLYQAAETYQQIIELIGDLPQPIACDAYVGLARISYEWNDLDTAHEYVEQSAKLAQQFESADRLVPCEILRSRLRLTQGDAPDAARILAQAEKPVRQHQLSHRIAEIAEVRVRVLLHQGKLAEAAELAEQHKLPFSQARVQLARETPSAALANLEPVAELAAAKNWQDDQLKVMVLRAAALYAQGEEEGAIQQLSDALALAAPGGFIRSFVDEGEVMHQLIADFRMQIEKQSPEPDSKIIDYVDKLLGSFSQTIDTPQAIISEPKSVLIEPLSPREREILQLIAQGLSNQEISERLFLALSTVKGHNRKIYGKLQVQRRTEAVARARELGLV